MHTQTKLQIVIQWHRNIQNFWHMSVVLTDFLIFEFELNVPLQSNTN